MDIIELRLNEERKDGVGTVQKEEEEKEEKKR